MAEAVKGIDVIWLYRLLEDAATEVAGKLAYQTEGETTEARDADTVATKDGSIRVPGALESEGSVTSILAKDDTMVTKLRDALRDGKLVEFWEIDSSAAGVATGKHKATYYQGYITEFSKATGVEDLVEVSFSYVFNGKGQDGEATLTTEQLEVVNYVFKDTVIEI